MSMKRGPGMPDGKRAGAGRLGLKGNIILLSTVLAAIPAIVMLPTTAQLASDITQRAAATTVRENARFAASSLSATLGLEWRKHERLAASFQDVADPTSLRGRLNGLRMLNEHYTWTGLALSDGRVAVAAEGMLEGASVAARPWFTAGLQGIYAGDVHTAVMLQKVVAPNSRDPLHLIDMALPVRRSDGTVTGVFASHLSWEWVKSLIRGVPRSEHVDVLLVSRDGQIIIGPEGLEGTSPKLPSLMAAQQSVEAQRLETWPDGISYLTVVVPEVSGGGRPTFGWSIIARQRQDVAFDGARRITTGLLRALLVSGVLMIIIGVFAARHLRAPLARLTSSAIALGNGRHDEPVPEERRYREVGILSAALAAIHSRLTAVAAPAERQVGDQAQPPLSSNQS